MPEVKVPDLSRWNHPRIIYAERSIPAGQTLTLTSTLTRTGRDMVIDLMGLSAEDYTPAAGGVVPDVTYIRSLNVNYMVTERPWWLSSMALIPAPAFHNYPGDHSLEGWFQAAASDNLRWSRLMWAHKEPWTFNPVDTLSLEYSVPAILNPAPPAVPYQATSIMMVADGSGEVTGLRRVFRVAANLPQQPAVPRPQALQFSDQQDGNNQGNEPFRMHKFGFINTSTSWAANADLRLLNVFRAKVIPSIGDSWSDTGVPLCFYGPDMSPAHRVAWHRPPGGPLYLRAGQAVTMQVQNTSAVELNVQLALVGRVAFGVGSVGV